jgi:predicted nucleic acid-binding protein
MPSNIIADASCLVLLEKINKLDILPKLFDSIFITATVADEFGSDLPKWIKVKDAKDKKYVTLLETNVDSGEASSIALAAEIGGLLILDDIKARKLALELKLDYTGTLGILVDAKRSGFIKSLKEILNKIKQTNFYLTEDLERKLLEMADE